MRRLWVAALAIVLVLAVAFAAGCGGGDDDESASKGSSGTPAAGAGGDAVDLTQKRDVNIAMVTHGDGGSFWAVAKRGAEDAAKDMGITLKYSESDNDPEKQAQLIQAAVSEKVDGLAVSAPDPDALTGALKAATDAGIPVITLNSGAEDFEKLGATTHVGQTETIAGEGAGVKLKEAGAKKVLCVIHEQSNIGLNQRCDGAKKGFGGDLETLQVKGTDDVQTTLTEIQSKLQADKSVDGVLALNPDIAIAARDAVDAAGSEAKVATFDLSGDVVKAIKDGTIEFAVDQQQYLQGYLPVVFLTLGKTNANTVGGGQPVLTGPGFVTKDNADTVEKLAEEGTR
jgi:simple sugar transport system substrate-binding protein